MSGEDSAGQTGVELRPSSPFEAPEHEEGLSVPPRPTVAMRRRVTAGARDTVFVTLVWALAVSDALIFLSFAGPMYDCSGAVRSSIWAAGRG
ncbi:MAG: hypothetical protein ACJAZO_002109 [Myxococcota bacterium]|jgi:hypothetical protein